MHVGVTVLKCVDNDTASQCSTQCSCESHLPQRTIFSAALIESFVQPEPVDKCKKSKHGVAPALSLENTVSTSLECLIDVMTT